MDSIEILARSSQSPPQEQSTTSWHSDEETIAKQSSNPSTKAFRPSWRAWLSALVLTTLFAFISPMFLFRAYNMPVTPLLVPVLLYLMTTRKKPGYLTREEIVWVTSVVASGSSFAPAYQWIATIKDFGHLLNHWQQLAVVLGTQLLGWSLGHILSPVFSAMWPNTLPLMVLIQTLFPTSGQQKPPHTKRGRFFMLLTALTFVYQGVLSFVAPIFKSLCVLCLVPHSKILGMLGSGWDGAGILSLTFDWAAVATLQPFVAQVGAQLHYLAGALLMMYVLTPVGWHMDWWGSRSLPIVSTNVFDTAGRVYNVTLVDQISSAKWRGGPHVYDPYSPVRLTVNSSLGYIFAVAAMAAVVVHLVLWHSRWLLRTAQNTAWAVLRLWDLRAPAPAAAENSSGCAVRVCRLVVFTVSLGVAVISSQLGITVLPGWQALLAVVWATLMCIPVGFVEALGFALPMDLLPHILAGWMQGPGRPLETGYFHLWATAPTHVALGWSGVRGHQLRGLAAAGGGSWTRRGLLLGLVWGALVNHLSFSLLRTAQPPAGWHEEGEAGRLPAALSSELIVWGIAGPQSIFARASPYRLLFLYGALIGVLAPLLPYAAHRALTRLAAGGGGGGGGTESRCAWLARAARGIQVPLVLTGMVAVPTVPANFIVSGLAVAVAGHVWCRVGRVALVDRSLYNAALDTGTRLAVAALFAAGQVLATRQKPLVFASWWGNRPGNVEGCLL
ncbi:hypothetical protein GGI25_001965 [Coemansia spiralis]|uniref:OPT superfamily oligopeptide transporter n=1 Tax=Coemansia spiralis TaxID=417178 RepID=A0A9W8G9G3_9FUNG|nr:hypothetical protein GGI25_001965 [Coemansia spiralis]